MRLRPLLPAHPRLSGSFLAGLADPEAEGIEAWPGGTAAGRSCSRVERPPGEPAIAVALAMVPDPVLDETKKTGRQPQRKMMRKATWYHLARGMALGAAAGRCRGVRAWRSGSRSSQRHKATHAAGLVQRLLDAETAQVPGVVVEMTEYRRWTDPLLRQEQGNAEHELAAETACQPRPPARGPDAGRLPLRPAPRCWTHTRFP